MPLAIPKIIPTTIAIPGTATENFPHGINKYFGHPQDTWNVHLEGGATKTLFGSTRELIDRIRRCTHDIPVIAGHSYGSRIIMRAFLTDPDSFAKVGMFRLIHPPLHSQGLAQQFESNTGLGKILRIKYPHIIFTDPYIKSLERDHSSILANFLWLMCSYSQKVEIYADPVDPIIKSINPEYVDNDCFIPSHHFLTEPYGILTRQGQCDFYTSPGIGHNFENYTPSLDTPQVNDSATSVISSLGHS